MSVRRQKLQKMENKSRLSVTSGFASSRSTHMKFKVQHKVGMQGHFSALADLLVFIHRFIFTLFLLLFHVRVSQFHCQTTTASGENLEMPFDQSCKVPLLNNVSICDKTVNHKVMTDRWDSCGHDRPEGTEARSTENVSILRRGKIRI